MDLLEKLSVKLNFTYDVKIVADGKYGDQKTEETKKKINKSNLKNQKGGEREWRRDSGGN